MQGQGRTGVVPVLCGPAVQPPSLGLGLCLCRSGPPEPRGLPTTTLSSSPTWDLDRPLSCRPPTPSTHTPAWLLTMTARAWQSWETQNVAPGPAQLLHPLGTRDPGPWPDLLNQHLGLNKPLRDSCALESLRGPRLNTATREVRLSFPFHTGETEAWRG